MKTEDSYFIADKKVRISKDGLRVISDHINADNIDISLEIRYIIMDHSGIAFLPANLYTNALEDYPRAASCLTTTNKYKREIDRTYFKYIDDAEQTLNNIISFIKWLKNESKKMKKKELNQMMAKHDHLIRDVTPRQSIELKRQYPIGFPVKRRIELGSLEKFIAEESDLVITSR